MELHRLTTMVEHDPQVFNSLYEKTLNLRRKLTTQIDHRRFGVTPDEIMSWFDDKFMFVFNKYYHKHNPEILLGHIINALQLFKYRIIKSAYTYKNSQQIVHVDDTATFTELMVNESVEVDLYATKFYGYMKNHLSDNAYLLLELQLNPPPYILCRVTNEDDKKIPKITDEILIEYLGLDYNKKTLRFIAGLREEIKASVIKAKSYFRAS